MAEERKNTNKNITIGIIVVVVAVAAFFGGVFYQKSQRSSAASQFAQNRTPRIGQGQFGANRNTAGRGGFGGAVIGDVVSVDADSLTVKLQDGSSKIVNLSKSTTYSKTDTGSKDDIKTGTKVAAIGSTNSDGSVTAQNIQLNPAFRMSSQSKQEQTPAK
jgi:hypothetical protein